MLSSSILLKHRRHIFPCLKISKVKIKVRNIGRWTNKKYIALQSYPDSSRIDNSSCIDRISPTSVVIDCAIRFCRSRLSWTVEIVNHYYRNSFAIPFPPNYPKSSTYSVMIIDLPIRWHAVARRSTGVSCHPIRWLWLLFLHYHNVRWIGDRPHQCQLSAHRNLLLCKTSDATLNRCSIVHSTTDEMEIHIVKS